jgi:hypothetical protein
LVETWDAAKRHVFRELSKEQNAQVDKNFTTLVKLVTEDIELISESTRLRLSDIKLRSDSDEHSSGSSTYD